MDVGGDAAQRREHQVLQQMPPVDQNAGGHGPHQRVVDAVDLLGIGVGAGQGGVEDAHREQEEGVLEPLQIAGDRRFRDAMAEGLQVAGEPVDGIQGGGVVHQPMGQVGNGAGMGDVVALDEVPEQHRAPVFLMDPDAQRRL